MLKEHTHSRLLCQRKHAHTHSQKTFVATHPSAATSTQKKVGKTLSSDFPSLCTNFAVGWFCWSWVCFVSNFKLKCRLSYSVFVFCVPIYVFIARKSFAVPSIIRFFSEKVKNYLRYFRVCVRYSSAARIPKFERKRKENYGKWKTLRSSKTDVLINNVMLPFHFIYLI